MATGNRYRKIPLIFIFSLILSILALMISGKALCAEKWVSREVFISMLVEARGFPMLDADYGFSSSVRTALDYDIIPDNIRGELQKPISRGEALTYAVRCLGLDFEASLLASYPIHFADAKLLSPLERGCATVALKLSPAILNKSAKKLSPKEKLSLKEAQGITSVIRQCRDGMKLHIEMKPEKGVTLIIHREGILTEPAKWRIIYDATSKEDAAALAAKLESKGISSTAETINYEWRVRTNLFDGRIEAAKAMHIIKSLGYEARLTSYLASYEKLEFPRYWVALTMDPKFFNVKTLIPPEGISTLSTVSAMSQGAFAAINGGYYAQIGAGKAFPIGALMKDGRMLNRPYPGRTCLGWNIKNMAIFGMPDWKGKISSEKIGEFDITALNHPVKGDGIALFTPEYGAVTPKADGIEIIVRGGECMEKRSCGGGINTNDVIIAAYGAKSSELSSLEPGDKIVIKQTIIHNDDRWSAMSEIVQCGPLLLSNGVAVNDDEGVQNNVVTKKHPRSVIGFTGSGRWILFAGDGRNAYHSAGFSLAEIKEILSSLGVRYALNLDGGGSTVLLLKGKAINIVSDGKERAVSCGVGVFKKNQ